MFRGVKCISCSSMPNCQVAVCHMLTAGFFQRTWTVTGLSRRGREGVHFKIFPWRRTGRLPGRSRRRAFPFAWVPRRVPLPGKWIYRESGFHHGIGGRINGLGRGRVGIQLFPAAVARGGRRGFRSGGNVEIQGSGKCLRVFAEDHVAVNPPAVRVLGHFLGITVKAAWNPASSALEIISGRMKPPG